MILHKSVRYYLHHASRTCPAHVNIFETCQKPTITFMILDLYLHVIRYIWIQSIWMHATHGVSSRFTLTNDIQEVSNHGEILSNHLSGAS